MRSPPEDPRDRLHEKAPSISGILRFGAVGVFGFFIDSGALYAAIAWGLDHYSARILSFLLAVTATWLANRRLTFAQTTPPSFLEWLRYAAANMVGGSLNLAVYFILSSNIALIWRFPFIGVGIGSICGLLFNYAVSKSMVFNQSPN
jgi:putative flippase GtrA